MTDTSRIEILLATYNGAEFLAEQLESLLAQSVDGWRVLARDDGSHDDTVEILKRYAAGQPGRFHLIEDGDANLGAAGNFGRLMEHARAPYIMFCDQDDVWLPDKIERLMAAMGALEAEAGPDTPLLVHSDLTVVDARLAQVNRSYWDHQMLNPAISRSPRKLLVQNVVAGCASLFNRALLQRALPLPPNNAKHDWWVVLVAAHFGKIKTLDEPTVLYRQHDGNTLGARPQWLKALRALVTSPAELVGPMRDRLRRLPFQAETFLTRYGAQLSEEHRSTFEQFVNISQRGPVGVRWHMWRAGFLPDGLMSKIVFLMLM